MNADVGMPVIDTLPSDMPDEHVLPCGHDAGQVRRLKLGCTVEGECRPQDEMISRTYFNEQG